MRDPVDKDILRFDIAMGDGLLTEIVEAPQYLIGKQLDEKLVDLFFLDDLVHVVAVVVHHHIQVLFA